MGRTQRGLFFMHLPRGFLWQAQVTVYFRVALTHSPEQTTGLCFRGLLGNKTLCPKVWVGDFPWRSHLDPLWWKLPLTRPTGEFLCQSGESPFQTQVPTPEWSWPSNCGFGSLSPSIIFPGNQHRSHKLLISHCSKRETQYQLQTFLIHMGLIYFST